MSRRPPRLFGGKRLYRKKWHLGEFSVYGFAIETGNAKDGYDANQYMDDFIDLIESLGLECGGGMGPHGMDMYVSGTNYRSNPTNEQRETIKNFVENRFEQVRIGDYENSWHPELPCYYEG